MKRSICIFILLVLSISYAVSYAAISTNKGDFNSISECKTHKQPDKCPISDVLTSKNNQYYGVIKSDGCFVIYDKLTKKGKWSTCKNGQKVNDGCSPRVLVIEQDGLAKILDCKKRVLWKTQVQDKTNGPFLFKLTDKGKVRVYDQKGKKVWPLDPNIVRAEKTIRLQHHLTNMYLHSHPPRYDTGSRQQEVTCYPSKHPNNSWFVKKKTGHGAIKHGDILNFRHIPTGMFLHSHGGVASPATGQQEVTGFWNRDTNDDWRVEIPGGGVLRLNTNFKLIHVNTNHALHSHAGPKTRVTQQQEVTGYSGRDDNDWWKIVDMS